MWGKLNLHAIGVSWIKSPCKSGWKSLRLATLDSPFDWTITVLRRSWALASLRRTVKPPESDLRTNIWECSREMIGGLSSSRQPIGMNGPARARADRWHSLCSLWSSLIVETIFFQPSKFLFTQRQQAASHPKIFGSSFNIYSNGFTRTQIEAMQIMWSVLWEDGQVPHLQNQIPDQMVSI